MTLVVRTDDRPEPVISAVRSIVRQVNPSFAIFNIKSFDAVITESLSGFTIYLWLMVGFAALAVVLATTGVYGVIAFVAAARTREFAIRVAVGADTARVTRLVLSHGARLAVFGTAVGIIATILTRPLLQNLPISVRPPDLTLIVPIAIFVAVIAVAACAVPALRAAHADLFGTLRNE
jgi:ABC-type antimicrobial peptide transport system permease subunit